MFWSSVEVVAVVLISAEAEEVAASRTSLTMQLHQAPIFLSRSGREDRADMGEPIPQAKPILAQTADFLPLVRS